MLLPCNHCYRGVFCFCQSLLAHATLMIKTISKIAIKKKHETKYDLLKTIQDGEITARNKRVNTECDIMA